MNKPRFERSGFFLARPFVLLGLILCFSVQAHAYVDPGAGSMLLQGFVGLVAAASALAITYWRAIRAFVSRFVKSKNGNA